MPAGPGRCGSRSPIKAGNDFPVAHDNSSADPGAPPKGPGFSSFGKPHLGARTAQRSRAGQRRIESRPSTKHRVENIETEFKDGHIHGVDDGN